MSIISVPSSSFFLNLFHHNKSKSVCLIFSFFFLLLLSQTGANARTSTTTTTTTRSRSIYPARPTTSRIMALTLSSRDPHANMPRLGLGTWRSQKGAVKEAVVEALRVGYRHIDCAQVYENQHEVGEGIQEALKQGIIKDLAEIYVVSKIWNTCHSPPHVRLAAERILRELNLPKINQLLIHWPCHFKYVDDNTFWPKDENGSHLYDLEGDSLAVWKEMEKLVDEGLVESIGLSNFNEKEVQEIIDIARIRPACCQVECHPYFPQDDLRAFLHSKNMALVAYSPLGNLAADDPTKPSVLRDETLSKIAQKHNKSVAQVVIRWHLQVGNVVIPKSVTPSRIGDNADVFDFALSEEEMAAIAETGKKHRQRMVNPGFRPGGKQCFEQ